MYEIMFKNRKLNKEKLSAFGFRENADGYTYTADLMDGQMELMITVDVSGKMYATVMDQNSGEEYILHRVAGAAGPFIGQVKAAYDAVLERISAQCCDPEVFKGQQANAVITYAKDVYGDEFEYLWQKFPNNAIARRKDNQKWYAALLTISRRKLGFDSDEMVEILDLRMSPNELELTVDNIKYFPGYHMNKKHWITICLDGTVPIDEIYERIKASYSLAQK